MLVLAVCVSSSAHAFRAGATAGVNLEYTDNAALDNTAEVDDVIATASLGVSISEENGPVTGNADASVRWLDYLDNTFNEETYLRIGADAAWEQIRNRLIWRLDEQFSQKSLNTLAADTPSNTEDANAFRLSADAIFQLADRHTLTISPSFSDFYYETSNNDNQKLGMAAVWAYLLNQATSLSLNGQYTDVDYDSDTLIANTSSDYERTNISLGMAVNRLRSRYDATIGFTDVQRDMGAGLDGVTGSLTWVRDFTARSTITAHVSSDITDSSNTFLSSSINPDTGSIDNVQSSGDVLRDNTLRITYQREGARFGASAWTELRDLNYSTAALDREVQEVGARISYPLTALVTGIIGGSYTRTKDLVTPSTDKEFIVDGRLDYRLSRKLNANAGLRVRGKDSSVVNREYDELSIYAGVGYRFGN